MSTPKIETVRLDLAVGDLLRAAEAVIDSPHRPPVRTPTQRYFDEDLDRLRTAAARVRELREPKCDRVVVVLDSDESPANREPQEEARLDWAAHRAELVDVAQAWMVEQGWSLCEQASVTNLLRCRTEAAYLAARDRE